MTDVLAWLTFGAALIAAVGTFVGPFVAYRAAVRTVAAEQQIAREEQRQETVDQLIVQATGENERLSSYALAQLDYLLNAGQLTIEQTTAVRNALRAAHSAPDQVQRTQLIGRLNEALGE